jgi:hypothetical protein
VSRGERAAGRWRDRKVSIDHRPSSNRRCHRYTARLTGISGGGLLTSGSRSRVAAPFQHDRSPPILKGQLSSRREVVLEPAELPGPPTKLREEEPLQSWEHPAWSWGKEEPTRWWFRPMGSAPASAMPQPPDVAASSACRRQRSPPCPRAGERRQRHRQIPKLAARNLQSHARC